MKINKKDLTLRGAILAILGLIGFFLGAQDASLMFFGVSLTLTSIGMCIEEEK